MVTCQVHFTLRGKTHYPQNRSVDVRKLNNLVHVQEIELLFIECTNRSLVGIPNTQTLLHLLIQ